MCDLIDLFLYGEVDLFNSMAVDIAPKGAYAIDIAVAFGINEVKALCRIDYDRVGLEPFSHLCKGVPQIFLVELNQFCGLLIHNR